MLTKKQHDLLVFIYNSLKKNNISPSYDEMKDALGLASKSGIHRLITALEERGFIRRLPHRARALEVLKLPVDVGTIEILPKPVNDSVAIPMIGKIAAGVPIAALAQEGPLFNVPRGMTGRGDHYALEVEGESMIGAGILDGDIAVIKQANTARNNDIVVAYIVADQEATLKRLHKTGSGVELISENPAFPARNFGPDEIEIQGLLVGLVRQYH